MEKTPPTPLYPSMKIAATVEYVQACAECCRLAVELASASVSDPSVSVLVLRPTKRHAHPEPAQLADPRQQQLPISDTNGNDPAEVDAALFESLDPSLNGLGVPNGIDHEAKARA